MQKLIILLIITTMIHAVNIRSMKRNIFSKGQDTSIDYPIRVGYIDHSHYWYGDNIAADWGVPGYSQYTHDYNFIFLAFWKCNSELRDMALIWANAYKYFGPKNTFGNDTDSVQKGIKKKYNEAGIKLFVSAFGDGEMPTTLGEDPVACGNKFG